MVNGLTPEQKERITRLAKLARLNIGLEEAEAMGNDLNRILTNFEALQRVDTSGVSPTAHPLEARNIIREDQTQSSLSVDQAMKNVPRKTHKKAQPDQTQKDDTKGEGWYIKVGAIQE